MSHVIDVSKQAARRFLLAKQGLLRLSGPTASDTAQAPVVRPWTGALRGLTGVEEAVRRLGVVQIDPVNIVHPNQHLVLRNRVAGYKPSWLDRGLAGGRYFEYFANARCILPIPSYPPFIHAMAMRAAKRTGETHGVSDVMPEILRSLDQYGPLAARDFPSSAKVLGFWDLERATTKATSLALEILWAEGKISISHRKGNERYYNLTEAVIPPELRRAGESMTDEEARRALVDLYTRSYGLFDVGDGRFGWQAMKASDRKELLAHGERAGRWIRLNVRDARRTWWMRSEDQPLMEQIVQTIDTPASPSTYFLPPLDNVVWRRERLLDLFDFDYTWEIYTPEARRTHGPYTMPCLEGERLIGRMDAKVDRKRGVFVVRLLQLEPGIAPGVRRAHRLAKEITRLASFVGAERVEIQRTVPDALSDRLIKQPFAITPPQAT